MINSCWKGKKVLFIGDSFTACGEYPKVVEEILGVEAFYHCKNGAHIVAMVDGEKGLYNTYNDETDKEGILRPLTADEVADKDLIVFYGGYNNLLYGGYNGRSCAPGKLGDLYRCDGAGEDTIAGVMQYAINRIYEELVKADNLQCRILIVTVDCTGKNPWINSDGNCEFPPRSGKSYKNMAIVQKAVAERNSLPCCDLFHTSGINSQTWRYFGAEKDELNPYYSPYLLDKNGKVINREYVSYEHGESYYQIRDDKIVLEQYSGYAPYPYNCDQLHKSVAGYRRIGEAIAGAIISSYGI